MAARCTAAVGQVTQPLGALGSDNIKVDVPTPTEGDNDVSSEVGLENTASVAIVQDQPFSLSAFRKQQPKVVLAPQAYIPSLGQMYVVCVCVLCF